MSRERQKQQSEEVRGQILAAARKIIEEEGPEALSVRNITKAMGYSASIVYHYFKDKDEILSSILLERYGELLRTIGGFSAGLEPAEAMQAGCVGYIKSALAHQAEYKAIMLSSLPAVLAASSVLGEHDADNRQAIQMLIKTLDEGIAAGLFAPCDTKMTACFIWSALFGLAMRLITEGEHVSPERAENLIQNQIKFILKGLSI